MQYINTLPGYTYTHWTKQAEFHAHDDEVDLEDFCAIMERHKPENLIVDRSGGGASGGSENSDAKGDSGSARWGDESGVTDGGSGGGGGAGDGKVVVSRQEVISNLVELFKEVRYSKRKLQLQTRVLQEPRYYV